MLYAFMSFLYTFFTINQVLKSREREDGSGDIECSSFLEAVVDHREMS